MFSKLYIIFYFISFFITILFFPVIFLFIKLINVLYKIRFTEILSNRYGHLALNPEYYLVEKKETEKKETEKKIKYLDFFCSSRYGICNYELWKMWKKKIIILPRLLIGPIIAILSKIYKSNNPYTINNFTQNHRDLKFKWDLYNCSINLTNKQKEICKKILLDNNIKIEEINFVCLFNRDDAYINSIGGKKNYTHLNNFKHHNYKIKKFSLMANELTKRNIYVFRMGSKVEEKFDEKNYKIIDYANSNFRSELMDIFLASKCIYGISCGTGSAGVASLFRKPMLSLNANIYHIDTYIKVGVMLTKHYFCKIKERNLTLEELMKFKLGHLNRGEQLENEKIEVRDCTAEEIKDACLELLERIRGNWNDTEQDINLQKIFKEKYDNFKVDTQTGLRWHGDIIRCHYSSKFLITNRDWLN